MNFDGLLMFANDELTDFYIYQGNQQNRVGHNTMTNPQLLSASALFLLTSGGASFAAQTWDMPTAYPATNFQTLNAADFAACVATGTKGEINIVLHPNGSLFKGSDIKRAVQTGQAQIGERLLSAHENENAVFGTDSVPFLATTYEASIRLNAAAKPEIDIALDRQGLKSLYSVPWPPNGLYFNKEVNSVADMKGIKVRSYNKATAKIAEGVGMVPVSIEAAEISQAMAAGVISSLITSSVTGKDTKVWEQLNHYYLANAWLPRNTVVVNKAAFEALPKDNQAALLDCAAKAEVAGVEKSKAADAEALKTLAANGVQVVVPNDAMKAELAKIGEAIAKDWAAKGGAGAAGILAKYK